MATKPKFVSSLIAGLLFVPASAALAVMVTRAPEPAPVTPVQVVAQATTSTLPEAVAPAADEAPGLAEADALAAACGVDGQALVEAEAADQLSPEQQAALGALRPICEEAGIALPAAPEVVPAQIVQTVTVAAPAQATLAASQSTSPSHEDDDHDEDEDDDHDDDRDEDDDHDDDRDEDDE